MELALECRTRRLNTRPHLQGKVRVSHQYLPKQGSFAEACRTCDLLKLREGFYKTQPSYMSILHPEPLTAGARLEGKATRSQRAV